MGEMHPDLMGASRFKFDTYIGMCGKSLDHAVMRGCWLAPLLHAHFQAVDRVTPERLVNSPTAGQNPATDGEIMPLDLALG